MKDKEFQTLCGSRHFLEKTPISNVGFGGSTWVQRASLISVARKGTKTAYELNRPVSAMAAGCFQGADNTSLIAAAAGGMGSPFSYSSCRQDYLGIVVVVPGIIECLIALGVISITCIFAGRLVAIILTVVCVSITALVMPPFLSLRVERSADLAVLLFQGLIGFVVAARLPAKHEGIGRRLSH